jgi:leucyl/phenylalanyl-tRNA--protein transferase
VNRRNREAGPATTWDTVPADPGESRWRLPDPGDANHDANDDESDDDINDDDLVAVGADLEPSTLIAAYRRGLFPMPISRRDVGWFSPDPRGIIPLDGLHVTRSLRQSAKRYTVTVDTAFREVMVACARSDRPHGWINDDFVRAYVRLHEMGWAHSVECRGDDGELVGGLYGVRINRFFAGESMFSTQRDASKVALVALVGMLRESGVELLDVQWHTDHLGSLGAVAIPRNEYLERLRRAVRAGQS